ncbi:MAG: dienelactone hydrolase family protein [Trebonia sp.]
MAGSFGGKDKSLKGAAARLDGALAAADVTRDVEEYPLASHGFINDHGADDRVSPLFAVMARFGGMGFHEESARDARRRIVGFFAEHLSSLFSTTVLPRPGALSRAAMGNVTMWIR